MTTQTLMLATNEADRGLRRVLPVDPADVPADYFPAHFRVEAIVVEWYPEWTIGRTVSGDYCAWDGRGRALRIAPAAHGRAVIVYRADGPEEVASLRVI